MGGMPSIAGLQRQIDMKRQIPQQTRYSEEGKPAWLLL